MECLAAAGNAAGRSSADHACALNTFRRAQDGTIVSIGVSFIICVVWTLIAPEKDKNAWANYKNIEIEDGEQVRGRAGIAPDVMY